jgi:hypothetical protein
MSALMADHRDYADEPRQPSLFDALASPSARSQPDEAEGAQVVEFPRRKPVAEALAEPAALVEPAPAVAPEDEWLTEIAPDVDDAERTMLAPVESTPEQPRTQRAAGMPLSGPTLDDVVSRVWEGLVMGLPAACPVCQGEVLPAAPGTSGGSCTSCGTTID